MLSPPLCGRPGDGLWRGAGPDDFAGDGDDPGVCLGQALRAEPRALEGDPRHHDWLLRRLDHGHLRRCRSWDRVVDAASTGPRSPCSGGAWAETRERSRLTTRSRDWQDCTGEHNPTLRQHDEAVLIAAAHDLERPCAGPSQSGFHLATLIACITNDALDEREGAACLPQESLCTIAILYAGGMNAHGQEQAQRVG